MCRLCSTCLQDFQQKQYYVTGNLSPELFTDDCLFTDPTIKVNGCAFLVLYAAANLLTAAHRSRCPA